MTISPHAILEAKVARFAKHSSVCHSKIFQRCKRSKVAFFARAALSHIRRVFMRLVVPEFLQHQVSNEFSVTWQVPFFHCHFFSFVKTDGIPATLTRDLKNIQECKVQ